MLLWVEHIFSIKLLKHENVVVVVFLKVHCVGNDNSRKKAALLASCLADLESGKETPE